MTGTLHKDLHTFTTFFPCIAWTLFHIMASPYGVSRSQSLDTSHSV